MNLRSLFGGPSHKPAPNVEGAPEKGPSVQFLSAALARPFELVAPPKKGVLQGPWHLGWSKGPPSSEPPRNLT